MKIWEKLKSESKLYYSSSRKDTTRTGGGPSVIKIDPLLEQICGTLGRACTGIIGVPDSDYLSDNEVFLPIESPPQDVCITDVDSACSQIPTPGIFTDITTSNVSYYQQ